MTRVRRSSRLLIYMEDIEAMPVMNNPHCKSSDSVGVDHKRGRSVLIKTQ